MTDTLTATGLTISRGGRLLVDGLDLSLKEGTVTALIGPNGSGKTTTAWCLGLYDLDFNGMVTIDGRPSSQMSPRDIRRAHRTTIALQPQDLLLEDSWTPTATLRHAAWALGLPRRQRGARITDALAATGLTRLSRTRTGLLSGGERMRVALARTLLIEHPRLVILDEPTAGADEELAAVVIEALNKWTRASAAILVVTHDPRLVERAESRVALGTGEQVHATGAREREALENPAW
ncbi:ATP-binding cassette domain-containing protein [Actinomyces capricornis]|uniref:ABC transporter ATP-binding protein n=1 Tax=Actinomyces capricornis TaxID=2755559 RepID=A0ABN6K739_9ACTO|nr:ATP-binding cassette domain-containing protein [Actinomyces capricornis]BDA65300.1 ABC transporter ATP-binding protein [Actinomyces capricornis]